MLSYQPSFFTATEPLTSELFSQLIFSDKVVNNIKQVRQLKASAQEAQTLIEANPNDCEMNEVLKKQQKDFEKQAASLKRQLPKIIWQATFEETTSKKGFKGRWRKQSAAHLNGLFMLDVDHIVDPKETYFQWVRDHHNVANDNVTADMVKQWAAALGILLVHITPSGHGIRIVGIARMAGNLSDNQHWLASILKVECDESCKDASRLSFCPSFNDILYINKEKLFTYDNHDYDEKWGSQYRGNNSQPSHRAAASNGNGAPAGHGVAAPTIGQAGGTDHPVDAKDGKQPVEILTDYYGTKYEDLITSWFRLHNGGVAPAPGDRHRVLLKLAGDLRYTCNNKEELLSSALQSHPMVREYAREDKSDFDGIVRSVCEKQLWSGIPKRLSGVLRECGVQLPDAISREGAGKDLQLDYGAYWNKLSPLLGDGGILADAVADLPDQHKLAGVLAAGAMLGTYLSRTWWEHYDGKFYRLSFLVYIIGAAASGKSFITLLDKLLLAPHRPSGRGKVHRAAEEAQGQ